MDGLNTKIKKDDKRVVIGVDEVSYFGMARDLYKNHSLTVREAMSILIKEYCYNSTAREEIDQLLKTRLSPEEYNPTPQDRLNFPELPPIPEGIPLSKTEERQIKYLSQKFHKTKDKLALMDGSEPEYPYLKEQLINFFDSRMKVILGV